MVASGHQQAYIWHSGGVERIVLQPSYTGIAKDFGVFLAVPEIPTIDKVDAALFSELDLLTRLRSLPNVTEEKATRVQTAESSCQGERVRRWGDPLTIRF